MSATTTSGIDSQGLAMTSLANRQHSEKDPQFTVHKEDVNVVVTTSSEGAHDGQPGVVLSTRLRGVRLYVMCSALAIANLMMAMDGSILGMFTKIIN